MLSGCQKAVSGPCLFNVFINDLFVKFICYDFLFLADDLIMFQIMPQNKPKIVYLFGTK
jgi:hypothetical protein